MGTRVRARIQSNVARVIICLTFDSNIYPKSINNSKPDIFSQLRYDIIQSTECKL